MAIKYKISPKLEALATKHLAALGVPREKLTDTQWRIVVDSMRLRRWRKWSVVFFVGMALLFASQAFMAYRFASWPIFEHGFIKTVFVDATGHVVPDKDNFEEAAKNLHQIVFWSGITTGSSITFALVFLLNIFDDRRARHEVKKLDEFVREMRPPMA